MRTIAEPVFFAMRQLLVFLLLLSLLAAPVVAQNPDASSFEVKDVAADVTADSAAHARDQAIAEAQRTAFTQLLGQLGADPALAAKLSNDDIATLVQNFEVQNERSSAVRYIGAFTVQFRPTAVRTFLGKKGAHFTETRSPPIVILPLYTGTGKPVLWEDHNAWRMAWDATPHGGYAVPIVVPAGTAQDLAALTTGDAVDGKPEPVKAIIAHYQAGSAATVTLNGNIDTGGAFKVILQRYTPDGMPSTVDTVTLPNTTDKTAIPAMLAQAVKTVRAQIDKDWRQDAKTAAAAAPAPADDAIGDLLSSSAAATPSTPPSPGITGPVAHLNATAPITTLAVWARLRQRLATTPGVAGIDVISLQRGAAVIDIRFTGTVDNLRGTLLSQNIQLEQDPANNTWIVHE